MVERISPVIDPIRNTFTVRVKLATTEILPIGASALLSSKIVKGATLKIYPGAPHGMCSTLKDRVNEELLAFIGQGKVATA